jgi:hypothetical protein
VEVFVADINVERKGPSIWPWIVGLIVLALLIWALVEMFGRDDVPTQVVPANDTLGVYQPGMTDTGTWQPVASDTAGWEPAATDTISP